MIAGWERKKPLAQIAQAKSRRSKSTLRDLEILSDKRWKMVTRRIKRRMRIDAGNVWQRDTNAV